MPSGYSISRRKFRRRANRRSDEKQQRQSAFPEWGGISSYFTSDPAAKESEAAAAGYGSYDSGYGSGSTSGYEQPGAGVREGKEEKGAYAGYGYGEAAVQSKEATEKGEYYNVPPVI